MARRPRLIGDDLVYHAINRGNNRAVVFTDDDDRRAFLEAIGRTREKYPFRLLGYCLMSNHFHLLLSPDSGQSISRILQSLTVTHTWRHHKRHRSSGHVWQGRFRSPAIERGAHLLAVLRYIEANPVRARMVADPAEYPWSSFQRHGLGEPDPLLDGVPDWEAMGRTDRERCSRWRRFVVAARSRRDLEPIRSSLRSGRPYGSEIWVAATARRLGVDLNPRPRGRPRKTTI
jgi:putative transposase